MTKKIVIGFLLVVWMTSFVLAQITPSVVTNNDYRLGMRYSECRNSARSSDGTIAVVWETDAAFSKEIYYSMYDELLGGWSAGVQLSNTSTDTRAPGLVADDAGNLYAEWEESQGGIYSVMVSKYDGSSWSTPVEVDTFSSTIGMANIGVSPDGNMIVVGYLSVWGESGDVYAAISTDGGANWSNTNLTANSMTPGVLAQRYAIPSIVVTNSGNAHMIWYDVPDEPAGLATWWSEVVLSSYDGSTWSAPTVISVMEDGANYTWDSHGVIALDPDENLHFVYASNDTSWEYLSDGKPTGVVYYRNNVGGSWSDPIRIDESTEPSAWEPCIAIGPNGGIYVTYSQLDPLYPTTRNSYYVTSANGGASFTAPAKVSNNTYPSAENFPEISIGSVCDEISGVFTGGADITWIEYDTTTAYGFNVMHGVIPRVDVFIRPVYLQTSVVTNNDYRLGMRYSECRNSARSSDGTIAVVWETDAVFSKEIYYSMYDELLGGWSAGVQLSNTSTDTRAPGLVADDAGKLYAEWEESQGGIYSVMVSKYDGSSWSTPVEVDTFSSTIGMANIGVSPDGNMIVVGYLSVWGESGDVYAAISTDGGANWSNTNLTKTSMTPGTLAQRYAIPSIVVTNSGNAHMIWYDVPDEPAGLATWWSEVVLSSYDGSTWSAPEVISVMEDGANYTWDSHGVIALDPDENLHLVYASNDTSWEYLSDGKPTGVVYYRNNVGGSWSNPVRIDESTEPSAWEPCINIGTNGAIYITYSQLDPAYPDTRNGYYVTSGDGGVNFSVPVKVSDNTYPSAENFPEISIGTVRDEISGVFTGGADITWIEYNTTTTYGFNIMHGVIPRIDAFIRPDYLQTSVVTNNDYRLGLRYSECRNSARSSDGTIAVVWETDAAFSKEIYYSMYDELLGGWSDGVQLSNTSTDTRAPGLVADDAGKLYAEWEESQGGIYSVMVAKYDGSSWSTPVEVDTFSSTIGMANIGVSPDGNTIVAGYLSVWGESGDVYAAISTDGGANWSNTNLTKTSMTPGTLAQRYAIPSIVVTNSGTAHMIWYDVPDEPAGLASWWSEVVLSSYDGSTWSAPEVISVMEDGANYTWDSHGVIALDPDENLHLVYASNDTSWEYLSDGKPTGVVYYRNNVGGSWSNPVRIDNSTEPSAWEPCIAIGPNGGIYVTYSQLDPQYPTTRNSYYVTSANGGASFTAPVKVSNNTYPSAENFPEISIGTVRDAIGDVFAGGADITWIEYNTTTTYGFNVMHGVIPALTDVNGVVRSASGNLPSEYILSQNYPNPFNPTTTIQFGIPEKSNVSLTIYNIMGQQVRTLVNDVRSANNYSVVWDSRDSFGNLVSSGVYFYQLQTDSRILTRKMLLIK